MDAATGQREWHTTRLGSWNQEDDSMACCFASAREVQTSILMNFQTIDLSIFMSE